MSAKEFTSFIDRKYTPVMYELNCNKKLNPAYRAYGYSGFRLYREIYKLIKEHIHGNAVIADIGAFPGTFLRILSNINKEEHKELHGIGLNFTFDEVKKYRLLTEQNPRTKFIMTDKGFKEYMSSEGIKFYDYSLDYCHPHNFVIKEDNLQGLHGRCDIVSCMEVVEHLHTPYKLFDLINNLLKPGGICVLETNNISDLFGLIKLFTRGSNLDPELCHSYDLHWQDVKHPHIRFFSIRELKNLFEKAGFRVQKAYDFNFFTPIKYLNSLKLKVIMGVKLLNMIPGLRSHIVLVAQKK